MSPIVLNRDENRAKNLCAELERIMLKHDTPEDGVVINYGPLNEFNQVIKNCDLLINCTTMGMQGGAQTPDFSFKGARSNLIFYDLVYTPLTTPLHRKAQKSQLLTMGGLGMLINQAVPAFILFYEDDYRNNLEPYEYVKVLYTQGLREFGRDPELWEILKKDISEK